jgi:Tc5 transposase DNA-binding domain
MRKRSEEAQAKNNRVEVALKDYRNKVYKSVNATAKAHNVPVRTLQERVNGSKSRAEANKKKQILSAAEEKALVKWILEVSEHGYPPRKSQLREMAEDIRQQRVSKINDASIILVEYPPIGREWTDCFIQRHPCLTTAFARRIDASRVKETTADAILHWLNTTRQTIEEYQVHSQNIYNMDESGFAIGSNMAACVIINSQIRSQFQAQPGRQEWVTVVECICGDGSVIDPLVIFRGTNLNTEWLVQGEHTSGWRFLHLEGAGPAMFMV